MVRKSQNTDAGHEGNVTSDSVATSTRTHTRPKLLVVCFIFVAVVVLAGLVYGTWLLKTNQDARSPKKLSQEYGAEDAAKDPQKTIAALSKANESKATTEELVRIYNTRAQAYQQSGNLGKAVELYEKSLSIQPAQPQLYELIADAAVGTKDRAKAAVYYQKALDWAKAQPNQDQLFKDYITSLEARLESTNATP